MKYRHFISSRYTLYGSIAGFLWFSGALLIAWLNPMPGHIYIASGLIGLGLGFLWYTFNHRYQMLFHFNHRYNDAYERLEKYLFEKKQRWESTQLLRFGLMALLLLTMLTLMIFFKETKWAGIASTIFVALILAIMLKGWLDFNDGILLQDIRHNLRDHTSE